MHLQQTQHNNTHYMNITSKHTNTFECPFWPLHQWLHHLGLTLVQGVHKELVDYASSLQVSGSVHLREQVRRSFISAYVPGNRGSLAMELRLLADKLMQLQCLLRRLRGKKACTKWDLKLPTGSLSQSDETRLGIPAWANRLGWVPSLSSAFVLRWYIGPGVVVLVHGNMEQCSSKPCSWEHV